jgi:hypothetical protein
MPNYGYDYPIPLDPNTMQPMPMGSMNSSSLGQQPNFRWQAKAGDQFRGFMNNPDLAMALLANSGPSPYKRGFGEVLGTSMLQVNQLKSQREDDAFKRQYMQAQMAAMQGRGQRKPIAVLDESGKPVLVDEQDAIGKQPYAGGNDAKPSALIQAYNLATTQGFKGSILEFQEQLAKASAQYPYALGEQGGVPTMFPRISPNAPSQPQAPGTVTAPIPVRPLSTLDAEANAKTRLSAAGAYGAETGQATGKAAFDLPRVEANVAQAVGDIDKLIKHPGLSNITGLQSKIPIIPGTNQAGADALAKQVQGQTFLQAYNSLKGGGAITEAEGTKAEAAIARLSRAQDTEEYVEALEDLKKVLDRGLKKARRQAGKEDSDKEDPLGIR